MAVEEVTWATLGCPTKIGLYRLDGAAIRVKHIHILAADNDPAAIFTIVALRPPMGSPEFMLGHRVA